VILRLFTYIEILGISQKKFLDMFHLTLNWSVVIGQLSLNYFPMPHAQSPVPSPQSPIPIIHQSAKRLWYILHQGLSWDELRQSFFLIGGLLVRFQTIENQYYHRFQTQSN